MSKIDCFYDATQNLLIEKTSFSPNYTFTAQSLVSAGKEIVHEILRKVLIQFDPFNMWTNSLVELLVLHPHSLILGLPQAQLAKL
jgi:hypothetical protein